MKRLAAAALLTAISVGSAFAYPYVLRWTEPVENAGDPTSGACDTVEVRASFIPVGEDTAAWWGQAAPVFGPMQRASPGEFSFFAGMIDPDSWVLLKATDEAGNHSWSNALYLPPLCEANRFLGR